MQAPFYYNICNSWIKYMDLSTLYINSKDERRGSYFPRWLDLGQQRNRTKKTSFRSIGRAASHVE